MRKQIKLNDLVQQFSSSYFCSELKAMFQKRGQGKQGMASSYSNQYREIDQIQLEVNFLEKGKRPDKKVCFPRCLRIISLLYDMTIQSSGINQITQGFREASYLEPVSALPKDQSQFFKTGTDSVHTFSSGLQWPQLTPCLTLAPSLAITEQ